MNNSLNMANQIETLINFSENVYKIRYIFLGKLKSSYWWMRWELLSPRTVKVNYETKAIYVHLHFR
jgi:hypothetical protein